MKKILFACILATGSCLPVQALFCEEVVKETYIVAPNAPPAEVKEVITERPDPGPNWVWRPGHWSWQGGWVWIRGHWVNPPHPAAEWVPGHWVNRPHGWVWIPGHWR